MFSLQILIKRWTVLFNQTGNVDFLLSRNIESRWPTIVKDFVLEYVLNHPCFHLEEIQAELIENFGNLNIATSISTNSPIK